MSQVWLAFLTGLTTGGISCIAVQGGLLASSMAQKEENNLTRNDKFAYVGMFLIAKLIAYTFIGFLLGTIGASLVISPTLQGWVQIFVGLFMLGTAARLLNLHPVFRYFVIQPPKSFYKLMKKQANKTSLFSPALLGALTVFIPCGVTQAMLVLALATGSGLQGAAIMFAFTLGASPVFFAIGVAALEALKRQAFVYAAAVVILILGVLSVNTGQILRGSPHTFQSYTSALFENKNNTNPTLGVTATKGIDGKQEVVINATSRGYTSDVKTIKAGEPVRLTIVTKNVTSCAKSFMIPSLNLSKILPENGTEIIEFTPTKTGVLSFTCGMGMFTGQFMII